jgi:hypothetical protein
MGQFNDSFRAARWVRLINLLLQAVLFLTLFGGLNYIALNHNWRFDLTAGHRHSLSAETKAYLDRLERDVTVTVTITPDDDNEELALAYRDITALLREYTYHTRAKARGKVTVRTVNIYQNRREAEELGLDEANQVILESDGRRVLTLGDFYRTRNLRREAFQGEATVTAAVLDVSNAEKKKIYFLAGHGEFRPDATDGLNGLSQAAIELRQRNFAVAGLDLSLSHKIPDDAALLVIASPKGRYQPYEEELLRTYLQTRAGRLLLMLDPGLTPTGLENLFFDWGVLVYDNVAFDLDPQSLTENNDLRLWNFKADSDTRITDNLKNNGLFPLVGPARVVSDDLGRSPDDGLNVKRLIATSPQAWGETNYRQPPAAYTPGQDLKGELGLMVISERLKPANNLPLSVRGGRLAVFGFPDLVTNNRINNVGNLNLFLATVNWAVDRDTQLNIPARPIERFQLSLSREELSRLRLGLLVGVPGLAALLGLIVWWTRRS